MSKGKGYFEVYLSLNLSKNFNGCECSLRYKNLTVFVYFSLNTGMVRTVPWREHTMKRSKAAKRSRKAAKKKRTKPDDKEAATTFVPVAAPETVESSVPSIPETKPVASTSDQSKPVVSSSRSEASRRTAEGKFTKAIFIQIAGAECPRFAAMTWKERDAYIAKPENAVRERYKAHMATVGK
jgi:hypothetical protein